MRRLFCSILFPAIAFAQTAPSLSLSGPATVKSGSPVTLTLSLVNGGGPAALQFDLAGLPSGAAVSSSVPNKIADCTSPPTRCLIIPPIGALNVAAIPDGMIATVQYPQGTAAATVTISATFAATPAGAAALLSPPASGVTVPVQSNCDLNGDGKVDATDIGLAVQAALTATGQAQAASNVIQVLQEIIAANGGACLR